jgi:DeoR/GlpR family transcriptional regulator of sugar metabolism
VANVTDGRPPGSDRGPGARRERVRRRVLEDGFASVDDLARSYDVSLMTMHRDLDALELEGWLTKIRGGATANPSALVDAGVRERTAAMRLEKAAIVEVAATMLSNGQTVFLDDSTTAIGIIPHLLMHPPATVATNFLPAVASVGAADGIEMHLLGGEYNPRQESCHGLQTVAAIDHLHADVFFMSTTALTDGKCLHRSEVTVQVREAFLRNSARSVLLVDHAKFGRPAPHVLCDVSRFDTVVTDDGIDPQDLDSLRSRCADVQVATVRR